MKNIFVPATVVMAAVVAAQGQVLLSNGTNYIQNFDTLPSSAPGTNGTAKWKNNETLPGWYAASQAKGEYKNCRVGNGEEKNNGLYSYGPSGTNASDRALGLDGFVESHCHRVRSPVQERHHERRGQRGGLLHRRTVAHFHSERCGTDFEFLVSD